MTFKDIRKEFSVDSSGITYVSKKGLGRLCGVDSKRWFRKDSLYLFNKKLDNYIFVKLNLKGGETKAELLRTLVKQGIVEGGETKPYKIMDILADVVIKYYAYKAGSDCTTQAELVQDVMSAVGFRSLIQDTLGWNKASHRNYDNFLLSEPRKWTKVFDDEYYDQLARLTGLTWDKKTHRKPPLFAKLTYQLVYSYLPTYVYQTIKSTQKYHQGSIAKMHQYLNPDSLNALGRHLSIVLTILTSETSIERVKILVSNYATGNYQYRLWK